MLRAMILIGFCCVAVAAGWAQIVEPIYINGKCTVLQEANASSDCKRGCTEVTIFEYFPGIPGGYYDIEYLQEVVCGYHEFIICSRNAGVVPSQVCGIKQFYYDSVCDEPAGLPIPVTVRGCYDIED
jgi:hypothetical protein